MSSEPTTREEAIALALDWAAGRRSWTNLGPHEPYTPDVIAVMDAQEVVKWTTIAAVLPSCPEPEPIGATEPPTWEQLGAHRENDQWVWGAWLGWATVANDRWVVVVKVAALATNRWLFPTEVEARQFVADLHAAAAPSVAPAPPSAEDGA